MVFKSFHQHDSQLTQWEFVERTWRSILCIRMSSPLHHEPGSSEVVFSYDSSNECRKKDGRHTHTLPLPIENVYKWIILLMVAKSSGLLKNNLSGGSCQVRSWCLFVFNHPIWAVNSHESYVCTYVRMNACMYVCIVIYVCNVLSCNVMQCNVM